MINQRKLCGMLGLAARAGKIRSGEFSTEKSLDGRKAMLCIIASDASDNTKKHLGDMCSYRKIPYFDDILDMDTLGRTIGHDGRVSLTVEDAGFAESIRKIIEGGIACEQ